MTTERLLPAAIAVHGVGIVSPHGMGLAELAATARAKGAARAPRPSPSPSPNDEDCWPDADAHWIDDFDGRVQLGAKGVSALDRMTQMAIVACGQALRDGPPLDESGRRGTGVVLGSRAGSMRSICDFARSTYKGLPHMVSPLQFPNSVMNCAAGQAAIWHGLAGVNSTVCAGDVSGLAALHYASRMLRLGHARRLLAGAVEEYAPFNAWAHQAGSATRARPFTEAAVVFSLSVSSSRDGTSGTDAPLAHLLGTRVHQPHARTGSDDSQRSLRVQTEAVLHAAGCRASDLAWFLPCRWAGADALHAQQQAVESLAGIAPRVECLEPLDSQALGHAHGAAVALDLALALACAPVGLGLLTSVGEAGQVGCLLVRKNRAIDVH